MMTKGPSRKQVIIPMSEENTKMAMDKADSYVTNINRMLKSIKSKTLADFIRVDNRGIIITTNRVANPLDLKTIESYINNIDNIDQEQTTSAQLPQYKSYLKILGIPYVNHNNKTITQNVIKEVIKNTHIFNNITLAFQPRIIKALPKLDQAVIWINIWDSQNSSKAKKIINCSFNVGKYIATVRGTNMNLGVPQCKNCWKWGHTTYACHTHGVKCQKCNGLHKLKHHRDMVWCCKANSKTNLPRLEMKKGDPCPHNFKCTNCKGEHQADSYKCSFWKHRFDRQWHSKKTQEL